MIVFLVMKPHIYKMENVLTIVILTSMKMKSITHVKFVMKLVKNVLVETENVAKNVMKTHTQKTKNVKQNVKTRVFMKMMMNGNVKHATNIVLNVIGRLNTIAQNVKV